MCAEIWIQMAVTSGIGILYYFQKWNQNKSNLHRHAKCAQFAHKVAVFDQLIYEILSDVNQSETEFRKNISELEDRVQL